MTNIPDKPVEKFAVGEIAIVDSPNSQHHNTEVNIVAPLEYISVTSQVYKTSRLAWVYTIDIESGNGTGFMRAEPKSLRKKPNFEPAEEDFQEAFKGLVKRWNRKEYQCEH